jgi:hypothetical protein
MYFPWPVVWRRFRDRGQLLVLVLGCFVVVGLLLVISGLATSNLLAVLMLLFVSAIGVLGVGAYLTTGRCSYRGAGAVYQLRLGNHRSAVFLSTMRAAQISSILSLLVVSVALFLFPVLLDRVPVSGSWRDAQMRVWAPFMPIFGVLSVGWALSRVVRKRGELGIGLSPEGVYHWAWFGCCFYAWNLITSVRPVAHSAPQVDLHVVEPAAGSGNAEENWVAQLRWYRRKVAKLSVNQLVVNPGAAYIALVFYHRHPELRHELAGEEGVTRIQKMDFPELIRELEDRGELRSH